MVQRNSTGPGGTEAALGGRSNETTGAAPPEAQQGAWRGPIIIVRMKNAKTAEKTPLDPIIHSLRTANDIQRYITIGRPGGATYIRHNPVGTGTKPSEG